MNGIDKQSKIALLIDADNANSSLIKNIIDKVENEFGTITVKRIYADWTMQKNNHWKDVLNNYAIRPIQKFAYTTGKNSTDMALVIDAMDLLHSKIISGFCIVSSDSDYTGLAHRIREEGLNVIGIGKAHTPNAFKKACITFIREESLNDNDEAISSNQKNKINYNLIEKAFKSIKKKDNFVTLAQFAVEIKKLDDNFDYRHYGFSKFLTFCQSLEGYEVKKLEDGVSFVVRKQNIATSKKKSWLQNITTSINKHFSKK